MTTKAYVHVKIGINVEIPGKLTEHEIEKMVNNVTLINPILSAGKAVYTAVEGVIDVRSIMYEDETE